MTGNILPGLVALGVMLVAGAASAASCGPEKARVVSPFTNGSGGWGSNTPAEVAWQSSGGNPGGYLLFTDATNATTYIDAPKTYRGSYAALNGLGYITFQHKIFSESNVNGYDPYEIRLYGPGGSATFTGGTPTAGSTSWLTVVAPLVEADWSVTSGTWTGLLANVTDLQIDIELVSNSTVPNDVEAIDNVAVVSKPCGFYSP